MCVVSMVGDFYRDQWEPKPWFPYVIPTIPTGPITPGQQTSGVSTSFTLGVTREEFDDLKRQVMEMKELLQRAKLYDERNNEPDCEIDEKMDLLRRVAAAVGVDLDDVLSRRSAE